MAHRRVGVRAAVVTPFYEHADEAELNRSREESALLAEALTVLAGQVSMKSTADAISRIVKSYKGEGR